MPTVTPYMSEPLSFPIPDLERTELLGVCLARSILACNPGALLLYGPMGAGKTTLTRFLVRALPGGREAEVASPSFTIANIYCTAPVIHHFDLYRLENGACDEALEESFDAPAILTLVEWPERLAERDLPVQGVVCHLLRDETRAEAVLAGFGPAGQMFMDVFHQIAAAYLLPESRQ